MATTNQQASPAFLRASNDDPYFVQEEKDNRHNSGRALGGRLGSALAFGFAMMSDDEDLSDC